MRNAPKTRFIVTRTSAWGKKPCKEAYRFSPEYIWHIRTVTEDEFNKRFSTRDGLWKSKGTEHTICNDGAWIKRKEKPADAIWCVDVSDILSFAKKYGDLVIDAETEYDIPSIEIYDTYRE